ncbi:MAG TPA: G1 family glutamic endopeptidase [Acidimicrobiales bacterium]|nr:G1 family glutamic endopeptidase [Acidimicrobiales bacterium]
MLSYRSPPAGFRPLHATPAQLARYGLPQRPASGMRAWRHDMARLHMVGAPPSLSVVEAHAASSVPDYSDHWAGYVAYGGRYIRTTSTWLEPAVRPSKCRFSSLTIWAGIGGYASPALAQDGTAVGTPGIGQHQAWWEMTPAGMVPVPLYATVGRRFTAEVHYLGGGRFSFFMENDFTGAAWSGVEKSTNGATLATAEAIVERPCLARCTSADASYANLTNFGRLSFVSARANGRPLQSYSNYAEAMSSSGVPYGRELAYPGPYGSGGSGGAGAPGGFSVTHNSCS